MNGRMIYGAWLSAAVLALAAATSPARAAEAFLCAPNVIVYVEPGELEKKKRTDACVASHFGLTIAAANAPSPASKPGAKTVSSKSAPRAASQSAPVKFKMLIDSERATEPPARRVAVANTTAGSAAETEYRRIRVLNAATPEQAWFHHTK
jgi:hypothetical protein